MTSRFVADGSIDAEKLAREELKEKEDSLLYLQEKESDERKSLADQLKDNRAERYAEYRSQLEQTNSSYRMDSKEAAFYDKLKREDLAKEEVLRSREKDELEEYKRLLETTHSKTEKKKVPQLSVTLQKVRKPVRKPVKKLSNLKKGISSFQADSGTVPIQPSSTAKEKASGLVLGYDSDED
ncbi:unnamed protein product [Kuraishia capsulata CBS 1993]|uniref:FAM192A/Fyv6 N-terminal domain-containing protein n=1 Tax=Kuraishia capsulata CBS 1993 TaxID=1382522 RepID=W6MUZ8_9ASCO|nr:uncharacterized protein KUCA_T00005675001 [Kuraishia capsulata CBS 1993]CDK29682.1 unnamed protein product [Kuraishia capsulata CBS 1993]